MVGSEDKIRCQRQLLAGLETRKKQLEAEAEHLYDKMCSISLSSNSLSHDRLRSAINHRRSRIPFLIEYVNKEIEIARSDIDKHHYFH